MIFLSLVIFSFHCTTTFWAWCGGYICFRRNKAFLFITAVSAFESIILCHFFQASFRKSIDMLLFYVSFTPAFWAFNQIIPIASPTILAVYITISVTYRAFNFFIAAAIWTHVIFFCHFSASFT